MSLKQFAMSLIDTIRRHDVFVDVKAKQDRERVHDFLSAVLNFTEKPTYYGLKDRAVIYVGKHNLELLPTSGLTGFTDNLKLVKNVDNNQYYLVMTNKGMMLGFNDLTALDYEESALILKLSELYLDIDSKLGKSDRKHLRRLRIDLASQLARYQFAYVAPTQLIYPSFMRHMVEVSGVSPTEIDMIKVQQRGDHIALSSGDTEVLM